MGNTQTGIGPQVMYRAGEGKLRAVATPSTVRDPTGDWAMSGVAEALCVGEVPSVAADGYPTHTLVWAATSAAVLPPVLARHVARCVRHTERLAEWADYLPARAPAYEEPASVPERALDLLSVACFCDDAVGLAARLATMPEMGDALPLVWAVSDAVYRAIDASGEWWWWRYVRTRDPLRAISVLRQLASNAPGVPPLRRKTGIGAAPEGYPGLTLHKAAAQWLSSPEIGIALGSYINAGTYSAVFNGVDAAGRAWAVKLMAETKEQFGATKAELKPYLAIDKAVGGDAGAAADRARLLARADLCLVLAGGASNYRISCVVMPLAADTLSGRVSAWTADPAAPDCSAVVSALCDVYHGIRFINGRCKQAVCDLKPDNVLLYGSETGGYRAVLADFGLNRALGPDRCLGTNYWVSTAAGNGVSHTRAAASYYDMFVFAKMCVWAFAPGRRWSESAVGWTTGLTARPDAVPVVIPAMGWDTKNGFDKKSTMELRVRCTTGTELHPAVEPLLRWALDVIAVVNAAARPGRIPALSRADLAAATKEPPLPAVCAERPPEFPPLFSLPVPGPPPPHRPWLGGLDPGWRISAACSAGLRGAQLAMAGFPVG